MNHMCYNCGCANPNDDMGDPQNITRTTLQKLSETQKKPIDDLKLEVFEYIQSKKSDNPELEDMFSKAAKSWGQPIEEAKNNTFKLLKDELKK